MKESYSLLGAFYTDLSANGFLVPVISDGNNYYTQFVIDSFRKIYEIRKVNSLSLDHHFEGVVVNPAIDQLVVLKLADRIAFSGYLGDLNEQVERGDIEMSNLPSHVRLQLFDLSNRESEAASEELTFMCGLQERECDGAVTSFARSASRAAFLKIGTEFLVQDDNVKQSRRELLELAKQIDNWSLGSLQDLQRVRLDAITTIDLAALQERLENRKPDINRLAILAGKPSDSSHEKVRDIVHEIRHLSRQERRLGRLISSIIDDESISEELFEQYQGRANYENAAIKTIERMVLDASVNLKSHEFFRAVINNLFYNEYHSQKGLLLKDLAREIGHIPEANRVLRDMLEAKGYLWSVMQWSYVIDSYLNGENLTKVDEDSLRNDFLGNWHESTLPLSKD